ncbi:hypothetical protein [Brucella sp. 2716]|uniref:hypothetical protein n=1 Tax=Brucella sp. 2716 TaxID=2975052 RepID=UPI00217CE71D|nr:hypothetical protein [Brucella sp. 2716]UWF59997.1 hypothetical protein NYO66_02520 [Brucella sp. 2716]
MNIHKNARLTPLRRDEMAVEVLGGRLMKVQDVRRIAAPIQQTSVTLDRGQGYFSLSAGLWFGVVVCST